MTEKEREEDEEKSSSSTSTSVEFGQDPLTQAEDSTFSEGGREMVGLYMSLQDQQNLRNLVKEFVSRLLPHLEAVLRKLNESVSSSCLSLFCFILILYYCSVFSPGSEEAFRESQDVIILPTARRRCYVQYWNWSC